MQSMKIISHVKIVNPLIKKDFEKYKKLFHIIP
jgi:hypothetical protein